MLRCAPQVAPLLLSLGWLAAGATCVRAADPEIDRLLQSPVAKDWVTNGGNLTNQRYSTLTQINKTDVKQLKGAWMTRLKGSGFGGRYSAEATPLVKNGVMYMVTGNDDVFALDAKTGEILWQRYSQHCAIKKDCWVNRGLAMGEGLLFLGEADAGVVALDMKTGKEQWRTAIEEPGTGYSITSAPLYYDGIVYSGISSAEFGVRGRLTALDAKSGRILWRWYTIPAPGEIGSDTWPAEGDAYKHGGASIWNTPALDPELGLVYFATGNCGPNFDGSLRGGDNLFCASIVALDAKTGAYAWHFQQVHHDLWDYDAASPVVLFDAVIDGRRRKGIAEAGKTGWVYLLDRTNGKPLLGIEERPVPQEPRQKTAKTQPFPMGDSTVPQCAQPMEGYDRIGCIFAPFWDEPVLIQPGKSGGTAWSPMPYSPDTGYFYVPASIRTGVYIRYRDTYAPNRFYAGGSLEAPIGAQLAGTFTAIDASSNKIAWQHRMPYQMGGGGGSIATAGGLLFRGEPDGNFVAVDAKSGEILWKFQTGFGADAPAIVYEVDGDEYIALTTGGNLLQGSAYGDAVWAFSLKGQVDPLWPPPPPAAVVGPAGEIVDGRDNANVVVGIGGGNLEYAYSPARIRVKEGTTVTFKNEGQFSHNAQARARVSGESPEWSTPMLGKGETSEPISLKRGTHYYICAPHPWMYGEIIVE